MPGESSCGQEWVSGEVTKREIRKQKASSGRGGMFAWGRAGIFFFVGKSKVRFFSASVAAWGLGQ